MNARTAEALIAARENLASFGSLADRRFLIPRHIQHTIDVLEGVERGEIDRAMLFMPPRHGKSFLTSYLFPAWYLHRHPDRNIIAASYGQSLANDFGTRVRNTMLDARYARIFPFAALRRDSKAAHHFVTAAGGHYWGVGYGGPLSGRGGNLMLIDDPIKNSAEADSPAHRQSLQRWYEGTAYPRLEPDAAIVIISTRWHQDDLAGWLLREHADDGWTVVRLPAIAEPNAQLGRREGHALSPERFPVARLNMIRKQVGGRVWGAEYQQRPEAAEGNTFKRAWWQTYDKASLPSRFDEVIISLDTAFKEGADNDYSAAVVVGVTQARLYVLDVWRGRVDFPKLTLTSRAATLECTRRLRSAPSKPHRRQPQPSHAARFGRKTLTVDHERLARTVQPQMDLRRLGTRIQLCALALAGTTRRLQGLAACAKCAQPLGTAKIWINGRPDHHECAGLRVG